MKKNTWFRGGGGAEVIEFTLKDASGAKLEHYKINGRDTVAYGKIIKHASQKYGLKPLVGKQDVILEKSQETDWYNT